MKTIKLQDFHNEVKKLAQKGKRTYSSAMIELVEHIRDNSKATIKCTCYVDGFGVYTGKTPNEAIAKLKEAMFPSKRPIPIVEVEL